MSTDIEVIDDIWQVMYSKLGGDPWWSSWGNGIEMPKAFGIPELHQHLPALMSDQYLTQDYVWMPDPKRVAEERMWQASDDTRQDPTWFEVPTSGYGTFKKTDMRNVKRSFDGRYLGKVGSDYTPISGDEIAESILKACFAEGLELETAGLLQSGTVGFFLALDTAASYDVVRSDGTKDRQNSYVLFSFGFTGNRKLTVCRTGIRVVCSNTERAALQGAVESFGMKHTTNWKERVPKLVEFVNGVRKASELHAEFSQALERTPITRPAFSDMLDKVIGIEAPVLLPAKAESTIGRELSDILVEKVDKAQTRRTKKRDKVLDLFEGGIGNRGETCFDAFNAATEYEDHHATVRGAKDADLRRKVRAMVASSTSFKQDVADALAAHIAG